MKLVFLIGAMLLFAQSFEAFSQTEEEVRSEVYASLVEMENDLIEMAEQLTFMRSNEIYDLNKMKQFSDNLGDHKNAYNQMVYDLRQAGLFDQEYNHVFELYRDELNQVITEYNLYKKQFAEYDKSERARMLFEAFEEIIRGFK